MKTIARAFLPRGKTHTRDPLSIRTAIRDGFARRTGILQRLIGQV